MNELAIKVANELREVGNTIIMPRFGRLSDGDIRQKSGPNDLVTEVDEIAERYLKSALGEIMPGPGFIGEEEAALDPSIVARLEERGQWWVVDPLDGTRNFVRSVKEFASIAALVKDGETIGGWIHAAPEERSFYCLRGAGVFVDGNVISPKKQADETPRGLRSVGWLSPQWVEKIKPNLNRDIVTLSGHCSAYGYIKLIQGEIDFKVSSRIHPWDHAAGALMLTELGGRVGFLDTLEPYTPQDSADRPLLAVAPGRNWSDIAARLTRPD